MAQQMVQTLKGFRDIFPRDVMKRQWVQQKITEAFSRFGFVPLETPTLEYASLLKGKYGAEADKLLYTFIDHGGREVGLRYDQTVPTARFIAEHKHELPKYFGRYQMQNVFRADKPQQGRFREFTQCDIDYFGAPAPIADAEILACVYNAYRAVGFTDIQLRVNDRVTLTNVVPDMHMVQAIDKLDKIGAEGVVAELVSRGLSEKEASDLLKRVEETPLSAALRTIVDHAIALGVPEDALIFTPTLARGLDYYTGLIVEAVAPSYGAGSLGGGGRYDHLIETLSNVSVPAVGFAIGFDRTVEAADALGYIPTGAPITALMTLIDERYINEALGVVAELRAKGIVVMVHPAVDSLGKQLQLADREHIPYALILGEMEHDAHTIAVKNLATKTQELVAVDTLHSYLSSHV